MTAGAHSGRVSARLGRVTANAASSAWSAGTDRADIADQAGHDAAALAGRAAAGGANLTRKTVGGTAKTARARLGRGRGEYVARLRLDRAKAKGRPMRVRDGGASDRIGRFKRAGRASARLGRTGTRLADDIDARLARSDGDDASRLATTTRGAAFRASRAGVSGVSSSTRFMWRHRAAPAKAARTTASGAKAAVRAAHAASAFVRAAVAHVAHAVGAATAIVLPMLPVLSAVLAVILVVASVMSFLFGAAASASGASNVPDEYQADVQRAGSVCQVVTASVIAAQIDRESGWDPAAVSPAGARGIAQFMPGTWASVGMDGDGDGTADVMNPHDAIWTQGNYMCGLAAQVESAKADGRVTGDTLQLTLAAYNAGLGRVLEYGTVPPFEETKTYIEAILELAGTTYAAAGAATGGTVGSLDPKLTAVDGIVSTAGMDPGAGSTYAWGQCTWWAAIRRAQIGRPVDPYMGNGGDWASTAVGLGYTVSASPSPGDVACFGRGTLGADADYGHVAVVEEVRDDGSILISEANAQGVGVVSLRTITAAQLRAAGAGIRFIR